MNEQQTSSVSLLETSNSKVCPKLDSPMRCAESVLTLEQNSVVLNCSTKRNVHY